MPLCGALKILAVLVALTSVSACSVFDFANSFNENSASSVQKGISYGSLPRQQLDWYIPQQPQEHTAVIIFFYGGGWVSGERADYAFVARRLAAMGYFVAVPDYRLYPEVRFPAFVRDGALAAAYVTQWLLAQAGDSPPVFLMGHSAGAHIAMLLALDRRYLSQLRADPDQLAGVIGLAGPYDFLPLDPGQMQDIFPASTRYDSQPIHFARRDGPAALLLHGDRDGRVLSRNSRQLADAISQLDGKVDLKIYPDMTHTGIITPFIAFGNDDSTLLADIQSFVFAHGRDDK